MCILQCNFSLRSQCKFQQTSGIGMQVLVSFLWGDWKRDVVQGQRAAFVSSVVSCRLACHQWRTTMESPAGEKPCPNCPSILVACTANAKIRTLLGQLQTQAKYSVTIIATLYHCEEYFHLTFYTVKDLYCVA